MSYSVVLQQFEARRLAAVSATMPVREVPARFEDMLGEVYSAARVNALTLDGQNVFVYRNRADGNVDVDFGVGVKSGFATVGNVACVETPSGLVATTTHWGDYARLGDAHSAIINWCRAENRKPSGVRWEVYGHWSDDPAKVRTDVFYQLNDI